MGSTEIQACGMGTGYLQRRRTFKLHSTGPCSLIDTSDPTSNIPYLSRELEKAMAPHSSTLAWKIPWTEEPGRLQSMGSLRVGHN